MIFLKLKTYKFEESNTLLEHVFVYISIYIYKYMYVYVRVFYINGIIF